VSLTEDAGQVEVVCPHCRKTFIGTLIDGVAARYRGFKCPHCKLFVPAERTESEADASS